MGSLSNYAENKIIDHLLKNTAYSQLSNLYLGLSTADPLDDASGLSEPSGNSYARIAINNWDTAASRKTQNSDIASFPEATGAWGDIAYWAIFDALTGGNMLAYGPVNPTRVVSNGRTFYFEAGYIDIEISSGGMSNVYANKVLDHLFLNTALAQVTNIYVALSTTTITDSDTGATITDPDKIGAYGRILHNTYDAASGGASENTGEITFATATGSWGVLTDWALVDTLEFPSPGGDIIFYSVLDASITIDTGDVAHWADGALDITLD